MKFGIFYEMFVPPGEAGAEARIIRRQWIRSCSPTNTGSTTYG